MARRIRLELRTLMILIALIGLALGGSIEWRNRMERDCHRRIEAFANEKADWHERELQTCRSHLGSDGLDRDPFDPGRADNNREGVWTDFQTWAEEARWHGDCAQAYRDRARQEAVLKQEYQRRLLLP